MLVYAGSIATTFYVKTCVDLNGPADSALNPSADTTGFRTPRVLNFARYFSTFVYTALATGHLSMSKLESWCEGSGEGSSTIPNAKRKQAIDDRKERKHFGAKHGRNERTVKVGQMTICVRNLGTNSGWESRVGGQNDSWTRSNRGWGTSVER